MVDVLGMRENLPSAAALFAASASAAWYAIRFAWTLAAASALIPCVGSGGAFLLKEDADEGGGGRRDDAVEDVVAERPSVLLPPDACRCACTIRAVQKVERSRLEICRRMCKTYRSR